MSGYRTPLKRARGLGSAKDGVGHWWMQRLTALALIPLIVWLVYTMAVLAGMNHGEFTAWLARPYTALTVIVFALVLYYHSSLGLQVVIEDYVHTTWLRIGLIITVYFTNLMLAAVSVFAVLNISLGAG